MPESTERSATLAATPAAIYDAWIDPEAHSAMTGSPATGDSHVGGAFTAWNGFIWGTWRELEPGRRLVMDWTTKAFPQGASPSRVEVLLVEVEGGTEVRVVHTDIPDGQGAAYHHGWLEKYFEPMQKHFG